MAVRLGDNKWQYNESGIKSADLNDTFDAVRIKKVVYTNTTEQSFSASANNDYTATVYTINLSDLGLTSSDILFNIDFSVDYKADSSSSGDYIIPFFKIVNKSNQDIAFWSVGSTLYPYTNYSTLSDNSIRPYCLYASDNYSLGTLAETIESASGKDRILKNINGSQTIYFCIRIHMTEDTYIRLNNFTANIYYFHKVD